MLTDLAAAVRKSGLKVVELDGWRTKTRPGSFKPNGVLVHHTGGPANDRDYVLWMQNVGRADLPAPLCQLALDRQGTVYVLAAGRANHGGTAKATGPMPAGDANTSYIGIEALNTGSEGWTAAQYDAYVALCAALCAHYDWPAAHVRAHRETSVTGKWDPGLLDMDKFRTDIATALQGDDMAQYEDQLQRIEAKQDKILDRLTKTAAIRSSLATLRKSDRIDRHDLDAIVEKLDELVADDA